MDESEKTSFLSLVGRFLSWRSPPGVECRNVSLREEDKRTLVVYDMLKDGKSRKRTMASGFGFGDCASESISYMCMSTKTSGEEELDLFLSSMGF